MGGSVLQNSRWAEYNAEWAWAIAFAMESVGPGQNPPSNSEVNIQVLFLIVDQSDESVEKPVGWME
jgi:hypothetical protein